MDSVLLQGAVGCCVVLERRERVRGTAHRGGHGYGVCFWVVGESVDRQVGELFLVM